MVIFVTKRVKDLTKQEIKISVSNEIPLNVLEKRLKKGWSVQRSINTPYVSKNTNKMTDSDRLIMFLNGVSSQIYSVRQKQGWKHEDIINTVCKPSYKYIVSHFKSHEMFALYINDMSVSGYKKRRKKGWGHKEAIFIPSDIAPETIQQGDYPLTIDELETIYQHGSTLYTYRMHRALGWSKEKAMTIPKRRSCYKKIIQSFEEKKTT